ncbi:MAG: glycoside hydrolase clan [Nocardioides sp.]|nr:glycoside hydrolase clan [Nocardioides sp.]
MLFPLGSPTGPRTCLELDTTGDALPRVLWAGLASDGTPGAGGIPRVPHGPGMPLLGEHAHARYTRPHLRGHRLGAEPGTAGRAWTTRFVTDGIEATDTRLRITAADPAAGLSLLLELESVPGGSLRGRATVTNDDPAPYVVDGLEVVLPVEDRLVEVLDLTGRHERERSPQRHDLTDGLWLREGRGGRPGLDAASLVVVGTPGFSFTRGDVVGVHVAWSGNSVLRVERDAASGTTVGGGEHLMPGEVVLGQGESYASPWVFFGAADDGLDGLAASWHAWQRSLPAHPGTQPVVLNVWEAVYFDHDLARLQSIADRAAAVGVELFVLDDGWFRHRRDDTAGLGDWWVDETVWPEGLTPLIEHVRGLGMQFGLWFEPEMVHPDSDLFREHPDWILSAGPHRMPREHRQQQVLDLTRPEVFDFLLERVSAILTAHPVDYVKWDHNRDLLEAGSGARDGAPAAHEQAVAFHRLLDALRTAFPDVAWESCASGGGRIDFSVLERVQRVWTSDMTDALARQEIQRWSTQLVAPEYLGAHVSSTTSHTTGRTLPIDFRGATALFGSFGIEWDLTRADEAELTALAGWVERYRRFRGLLHSGRVVRPESTDPAVLLHGVVAPDRSEALLAHVQLDESAHNRGVSVQVPGLDPGAAYRLRWEGPVSRTAVSMSAPLPEAGPTAGVEVTGRVLAERGFWMPRRRPETVTLVHLERTAPRAQ